MQRIENVSSTCRLQIIQLEKNSDSADTIPYWKPLSEMLDDYADHKETKSGEDVGLLPRLRMKIDKNQIKYVGKETSNLYASNILGVTEDSNYTVYDNLKEKVLSIRPKDAYKIGISRSNFITIQKKARENQIPKVNNSTLHKILENHNKFSKSMTAKNPKKEVIIHGVGS